MRNNKTYNHVNWWNRLTIDQREQIVSTSKELNRVPLTISDLELLYTEHFNYLKYQES